MVAAAVVSPHAHTAAVAAPPCRFRSNFERQARAKARLVAPGDKTCQSAGIKRTKTVPFSTTKGDDGRSGGENITTSDLPTTSSPSSSSDPDNILAAFAASAAVAEEAALAAALAGTSNSSSESESAAALPPSPSPEATSTLSSSPSPSGPNPALAAKIAAARAYKAAAAERAAKGDSNIVAAAAAAAAAVKGDAASPGAAAAAAPAVRGAPFAPALAGPSFTRSTPPAPSKIDSAAPSPSSASSATSSPVEKRGVFDGAGSETEPAAFLKGIFSSSSEVEGGESEKPLDPNMRAEEFTALKTARERARGADIITVDAGANAAEGGGGGGGESETDGGDAENGYRPRVATWGVFPRPDNISKTFGGGRTIRPGDVLEAPEEREARLKRQKAALESYRRKVGLVVDPRDEVEATRLVAVGNELMREGALGEAAAEFGKAADLLPARSAVGGRARLQRAICLDSMGKRDEAFTLYKSVEGHPLDSIGKETKRMLFGFQAMEDLKAHTISYAPKKEEYAPYFGKLKSDWDTQYVASEDEKEGSLPATVAAVAVIAAPLLLFSALALGK